MGCDIHEFIESREPGGDWTARNAPDLGRNYELFGLLTGGQVRSGGGPHVVDLKGLPETISPELFAAVSMAVDPALDEDPPYRDKADRGPLGYAYGPICLASAQRYSDDYGRPWLYRHPDGRLESRAGRTVGTAVPWPGEGWQIQHPDWHSHSYLDINELRTVIGAYAATMLEGGLAYLPGRMAAPAGSQRGEKLTVTSAEDLDRRIRDLPEAIGHLDYEAWQRATRRLKQTGRCELTTWTVPDVRRGEPYGLTAVASALAAEAYAGREARFCFFFDS